MTFNHEGDVTASEKGVCVSLCECVETKRVLVKVLVPMLKSGGKRDLLC